MFNPFDAMNTAGISAEVLGDAYEKVRVVYENLPTVEEFNTSNKNAIDIATAANSVSANALAAADVADGKAVAAQGTADTAVTNAATAQGTADSAVTAAATAQARADAAHDALPAKANLSGSDFIGKVSAQTPNSGTTGGIQIKGNQTSGKAYLQILDYSMASQWGYVEFKPNLQFYSGELADIACLQAGMRSLVGDGVTNDKAAIDTAIAATPSGRSIRVLRGSFRVGSNTTISKALIFEGGRFVVPDGVTLTINAPIIAPMAQIFECSGTGKVVLGAAANGEGWVDWWGTNADAIEAAHKALAVARLGPRDYGVSRTVVLSTSYRKVIGCRGSAENQNDGTRVVLSGAAVTTDPVIQLGTLAADNVLNCARRLDVSSINTVRDGKVNPAASGRREDAVPGWKICGWYESRLEHCFDYGSPIHYRVSGTTACEIHHCNGVRPTGTEGNVNGYADYYTGFCIGGYSTSFGFIGSNASLSITRCSVAGGQGVDPMGLFLFGYIGDTWVDHFECSQLAYGVYLDGRDAAGTTLTATSAHQDVKIVDSVIDAITFCGLTVRGVNGGGMITIKDNYVAGAAGLGDAMLIQNCEGLVSVDGGEHIGQPGEANFGIRIVGSKRLTVGPNQKLRNFRVPVRAESSSRIRLMPHISRTATGGTNVMELAGVGRAYIAPMVDSPNQCWDYGIDTNAACNYSEFNLTGIPPSVFDVADPARKLRLDGANVTTDSFGNNNIRTGVIN